MLPIANCLLSIAYCLLPMMYSGSLCIRVQDAFGQYAFGNRLHGPGAGQLAPPWAGDTGPRDARPGGGGGAAEGTEGIA